ncbi:MAG: hypothetical protein N2235_04220 [Fischerella sp.]|nr:hypothetical protein [Fischerella sp.]
MNFASSVIEQYLGKISYLLLMSKRQAVIFLSKTAIAKTHTNFKKRMQYIELLEQIATKGEQQNITNLENKRVIPTRSPTSLNTTQLQ